MGSTPWSAATMAAMTGTKKTVPSFTKCASDVRVRVVNLPAGRSTLLRLLPYAACAVCT